LLAGGELGLFHHKGLLRGSGWEKDCLFIQ
jgi:hypothetical protein